MPGMDELSNLELTFSFGFPANLGKERRYSASFILLLCASSTRANKPKKKTFYVFLTPTFKKAY